MTEAQRPAASGGAAWSGVLYALAAYVSWGLAPFYFREAAARGVAANEMLVHRVVWSLALMLPVLHGAGRLREVWSALRCSASLWPLLASAALIALNWWLFIVAVETGQLMQASMGYFMNPLVNVLLGLVLLRERLRLAQWISIGLATAGVGVFVAGQSEPPQIALLLAVTFSFYSLLRKIMPASGMVGLTVEVLLLAPAALGYMAFLRTSGTGRFGAESPLLDLFLATAGLVTALPLVWFAIAARRLPLSQLGMLQYIAPSMQLGLAVWFGEPFGFTHVATFGLIWAGLALYSVEGSLRAARSRDDGDLAGGR